MSNLINSRPRTNSADRTRESDNLIEHRSNKMPAQTKTQLSAEFLEKKSVSDEVDKTEHFQKEPASIATPPQNLTASSDDSYSWRPASLETTSSNQTALNFDDAILTHLDAAYSLARWLVKDPIEAEDIVQDACIRALKYFSAFRGENSKAWLLQIVRNTAYTKLGARRTRFEVALGNDGTDDDNGSMGLDVIDHSPGPEAALANKQEAARLKAAIAALPVFLRECLILREIEEFSYKEIAEILHISIGTVMSRLHRARKQLLAATVST